MGIYFIKETLLAQFPTLIKAGGFELLRTNGPYSRSLVEIATQHLSGVSKLKQFVDQARIYIRPVQSDLPVDECSANDQVAIHFCVHAYDSWSINVHVG